MEMQVRDEEPDDAAAVRMVNEAAFGRPDEANLVVALQQAEAVICSLVVETEGQVAGHVMFSPAALDSHIDRRIIAALGPVAVLPERQGRGAGTALIRAGLERCRAAGYDLAIVLGHPGYYPRFGFRPSAPLGIRWERDVPDEVFMVAELKPGALEGARGVVRYHPAFEGV